jgi:DNA-binding transcriptional LysR family regulator
MKLVCFAGKDQLINKQPLTWKDLNNYPLVSGPQTSVVRRTLNEKFKNEGVEMRPLAAEVDDIEWCIYLVEHGKGLSFAFRGDIERRVAEGRLKIIELTDNPYLSADAVMPVDLFMNPLINKFLLMVKKAFNQFE